MDIDLAMKIWREGGLPLIGALFIMYVTWRIGINIRDAIMWSGPKFLIPIRDGIVQNISMLTQFVVNADSLLPVIAVDQQKAKDEAARLAANQQNLANDQKTLVAMQKAMGVVISEKCNAKDCYFRLQKKQWDSDDMKDTAKSA